MQKRVVLDLPVHSQAGANGADTRSLLRVIVCGNADSGKSTLIEQLIAYTTLPQEQLASPAENLKAGREQATAADPAFRQVGTQRRKLAIAEVPGDVRCVHHLAARASTADLVVIVMDARQGVLPQIRRQLRITALVGIRHVVLAVNKMDLADYDPRTFHRIVEDCRAFAEPLKLASLVPMPISASWGDNVVTRSVRLPWYDEPALLEHLEAVQLPDTQDRPFRMPVQALDQPRNDFRGCSGTVACGRVRVGDSIVVAQTGRDARVKSIQTEGRALQEASAGDTVTLTFVDDVDATPGDLLAASDQRPEVSDQFAAHVVWMDDEPLIPGRPYLLKIGTRTVTASVTEIKHREDLDTFQRLAAKTLRRDEIGLVNLETHEPVAFDAYEESRETGSFALLDRASTLIVGTGMIRFGLRRATNVHWQALDVTKASRARLKGQRPCCLWFTGLSGSGKSSIANLLEKKLQANGRHTFTLDGDNTRHGLNRDLGFTDADRVENIRRAAHVAKLMVDAGLIVLVSFISPFEAERRMARELFDLGEFFEVFVDTPLEICEQRDVKGLYRKARAGQIQNFTGISSRYEPPSAPDLHLEAGVYTAEALADQIYEHLQSCGYFHAGPVVARTA